jgi:hypothetical protein
MKMADRSCLRMESQLRRWPRLKKLLVQGFRFTVAATDGEKSFEVLAQEKKLFADLLGQVLRCDPREHITAASVVDHPWFKMELRVRGEVTFPDWR